MDRSCLDYFQKLQGFYRVFGNEGYAESGLKWINFFRAVRLNAYRLIALQDLTLTLL